MATLGEEGGQQLAKMTVSSSSTKTHSKLLGILNSPAVSRTAILRDDAKQVTHYDLLEDLHIDDNINEQNVINIQPLDDYEGSVMVSSEEEMDPVIKSFRPARKHLVRKVKSEMTVVKERPLEAYTEKELAKLEKRPEPRYECKICKKKLSWKSSLNLHMRKVHNNMNNMTAGSGTCEICGRVCGSVAMLHRHMDTHSAQAKYECTECGNKYRQIHNLRTHMRKHDASLALKCKECGFIFASVSQLKQHQIIHQNITYKCDVCLKEFKSKVFHKYHMRLHGDVNVFICQICGQKFPLQCYLTKHMENHSDVNCHVCKDCGNSYKHRRALRRHEIQAHGAHMKTHYKCNICNKIWATPSSLRHHLETHAVDQVYKCDFCNRKFYRERALKLHMNSHLGNRASHTCDMCHKSFTARSLLIIHMVSHDSLNRYTCEFCNCEYKYRSTLRRHLLDKHEWQMKGRSTRQILKKASKCVIQNLGKKFSGKNKNKKLSKLTVLQKNGRVKKTRVSMKKSQLQVASLFDSHTIPKKVAISGNCKECERLYPVMLDAETCLSMHGNAQPHLILKLEKVDDQSGQERRILGVCVKQESNVKVESDVAVYNIWLKKEEGAFRDVTEPRTDMMDNDSDTIPSSSNTDPNSCSIPIKSECDQSKKALEDHNYRSILDSDALWQTADKIRCVHGDTVIKQEGNKVSLVTMETNSV